MTKPPELQPPHPAQVMSAGLCGCAGSHDGLVTMALHTQPRHQFLPLCAHKYTWPSTYTPLIQACMHWPVHQECVVKTHSWQINRTTRQENQTVSIRR